jgi:hypothetical protein
LPVILGYSEATIATLIGHKRAQHHVAIRPHRDTVLLAAVDAVADKTMKLMGATQSQFGIESGATLAAVASTST